MRGGEDNNIKTPMIKIEKPNIDAVSKASMSQVVSENILLISILVWHLDEQREHEDHNYY